MNAKIAENPDDGGALYRRGQLYASKGIYNLAIKDFDDTIRLNPKDVEAYNNRCWTRSVIGDLQPALRDCNEALRLRPNFVDALDSRGLVNLKSGLNKNAIADFDAALKINPQLTSSLYGRGLARQRNGSISDGDVDVNNAKAMDPILSRNLPATECAEPPMHFFCAPTNGATFEPIPRERVPEGGLPMSTNSTRRVAIAVLSFFAIGATLSIGTVKAEDVTEDQILRALAPEKKPLTPACRWGRRCRRIRRRPRLKANSFNRCAIDRRARCRWASASRSPP